MLGGYCWNVVVKERLRFFFGRGWRSFVRLRFEGRLGGGDGCGLFVGIFVFGCGGFEAWLGWWLELLLWLWLGLWMVESMGSEGYRSKMNKGVQSSFESWLGEE